MGLFFSRLTEDDDRPWFNPHLLKSPGGASAVSPGDLGALAVDSFSACVPEASQLPRDPCPAADFSSLPGSREVDRRALLFFVGSRNNLSVIAKFVPNEDGVLRFGGVRLLHEAIHAKPVASHEHIGYVVRAPGDTLDGGGARQKQLPISSIGRWLADWCPYTGNP